MKNLFTRRRFIEDSIKLCSMGPLALSINNIDSFAAASSSSTQDLKEAGYYEKLPNRKIKCVLCPRECVIDDQETGYCGVRENYDGKYYTLVYGRECSAHIDPIEKKPLFHFLPSSNAFSIATVGCNVLCKFCQNWQISQARPDQVDSIDLLPDKLAEIASLRECKSIAYTYTEPVVFTEYMYDCAEAAHKKNLKNAMISNGYIQAKPMNDLCNILDAVKIDLKGYTEKFYKKFVDAHLQPVLDTLVLLKKNNIWFEIVYLVIPTLNDTTKELQEMSKWIVNELGRDVPIHFSRFYPQYRLKNLPPTPVSTLEKARNIALEAGLQYVYLGNVPGHEGENTFCPDCKKIVIKRIGYRIIKNDVAVNGICKKCGFKIAGLWI